MASIIRRAARFPRAALYSLLLLGFCLPQPSAAGALLDFTTMRLGEGGRTALVVGGIQGDEPGGFSAASLLATHYEILEGSVWVVPNLNFPSMIKRSRGLYGDMNRKFAFLDENDPEYPTVRRIQGLIREPRVALVLNLHDGSGYYRPEHEDKLKNPKRWGQSIIIDQASMKEGVFMGDLERQADLVAKAVNRRLLEPPHAIHIRNTNTAMGDREMEKSLSYYAMRHGKAAFGLEASKEFPVHWRAYYHLSMIEKFLALAGIKFKRSFKLTPGGVEAALSRDLGVAFADNRVFLPLDNARPRINGLPLPAADARPIMSRPIMAALPCGEDGAELCIHYGNRTITLIKPELREFSEDLQEAAAVVDGREVAAHFGRIIDVRREAVVKPIPGHRVNAIGFSCGKQDEAGEKLTKNDFQKRFSIDKAGTLFRVEIYKDKAFAGMFLLRFGGGGQKSQPLLPAAKGPESALGF